MHAAVEPSIACVAATGRLARALSSAVAGRAPGARIESFSLTAYLAAKAPPYRVVLCPPGRSAAEDLAFLERVSRRLLWPAPDRPMASAIGGLRGPAGESDTGSGARRAPRKSGGMAAAVLLEGEVPLPRARAALRARGPRHWIVETPGRVRISPRGLEALARQGIRWSALDPVVVVALYVSPALGRRPQAWKALVPPRTPVWIRTPRGRSRRPRRRIP